MEDLQDLPSNREVPRADDVGIQMDARRAQGVDGRIETGLDPLAREHHDGVQVAEDADHRRIGRIVSGHERRLDGRDGTVRAGPAALSNGYDLVLIGRRQLRPGLGKPVDVIHEKEDVEFLCLEMLSQRDAGQHDLKPRAGWLVHLAEDQAHLVQEPGLLQFVVELVPLTNPLANPGEDASPLMSFDDIVDELQGEEALSQCGAAEDARLAALDQRIQEVDDLDAGFQNLVAGPVHVVGIEMERGHPLPDGQL